MAGRRAACHRRGLIKSSGLASFVGKFYMAIQLGDQASENPGWHECCMTAKPATKRVMKEE